MTIAMELAMPGRPPHPLEGIKQSAALTFEMQAFL
jgi:hypothetical protein